MHFTINTTIMSVNVHMEFAVEMTCDGCVDSVKEALHKKSVRVLSADVQKQQILVESNLPFYEIQDIIETTGKRAALIGQGPSIGKRHLGAAVVEIANGPVKGVVRLLQMDEDNCLVEGTVDGLTPGKHGLNVHEYGDLSNGCLNCGEHFNPTGKNHGGRNELERHVGDLGNIEAGANGRSVFRFLDEHLKVWDIIGRSMVIHADPDDLGKTAQQSSSVDGNSGPGIACAIIARSSGLLQNSKRFCTCDGISIWDERYLPAAGKERSQFSQKL